MSSNTAQCPQPGLEPGLLDPRTIGVRAELGAIEKYVKANFKVGDTATHHVKTALKKGTVNGTFVHTKGVGASGSFKLPKEQKKPAKKPTATKISTRNQLRPRKRKFLLEKNPSSKKAASKKPAVKKPSQTKSKTKPKVAAKKPSTKKEVKKPAAAKKAKVTKKK